MLEAERRWRDFYNRWAGTYDLGVKVFSLLLGFRDALERQKLVSRLELRRGADVLEVCVGTGSNLPFIAEETGIEGHLVGLDISFSMLMQCRKKVARKQFRTHLTEGEAAFLPFLDNVFDAVLNFGGINALGDNKRGAIDEMIRVAKPGARIVISDRGLPPDQRSSLRNRLLLRLNRFYASRPPLCLIPPGAKDVHLTWFRSRSAYILDFVKP